MLTLNSSKKNETRNSFNHLVSSFLTANMLFEILQEMCISVKK